MTADLSSVIRLTKAHLEPAAAMMSRAFVDYPLGAYFTSDASMRDNRPSRIFQSIIRYGLLYGEVNATSPNLEGVAVWLPSDKVQRTLWRNVRSGNFPMFFRARRGERSRQRAFNDYVTSVRRRHVLFPHLYLQIIGVDPIYQGKGYGSILLRHMFTRIDEIHLPCYLETHAEKNVAFYQHHGFQVVEEAKLPASEIMSWAMLRDNRG